MELLAFGFTEKCEFRKSAEDLKIRGFLLTGIGQSKTIGFEPFGDMSGVIPMKFEKSPAAVMNYSELLFQYFREREG